ncbi:hypothetical protein FB451DRAFT_1183306 [Mycena latifolia]|nr:hypothetical protein FB451DRAFT_1183306 [Mycena latifolia]
MSTKETFSLDLELNGGFLPMHSIVLPVVFKTVLSLALWEGMRTDQVWGARRVPEFQFLTGWKTFFKHSQTKPEPGRLWIDRVLVHGKGEDLRYAEEYYGCGVEAALEKSTEVNGASGSPTHQPKWSFASTYRLPEQVKREEETGGHLDEYFRAHQKTLASKSSPGPESNGGFLPAKHAAKRTLGRCTHHVLPGISSPELARLRTVRGLVGGKDEELW